MQRLIVIAATLALTLGGAMTTHARVPIPTLAEPSSVGSQVVFYYDTREGFTTFANISSLSSIDNTVQIDFWGPTFETKVSQVITLKSAAVQVIDVGALKTTLGLGAQQGIAVASVINDVANPINRVVLTGNFTVANLATGSAWGSPVAGRAARNISDGSLAAIDAVVDGLLVVYPSFQVGILNLAAYYDPKTLAPVSEHGNQVIFVSFKDAAGIGLPLTAASTTWQVDATRADQKPIPTGTLTVSGVTESNIVALLGDAANGAPGRAFFSTTDLHPGESHLIFFVQSLGTFGTGYRLPSILN